MSSDGKKLTAIVCVLCAIAAVLLVRVYTKATLKWSTIALESHRQLKTPQERLFEALDWIVDEPIEARRGHVSHLLNVLSEDASREVGIYVAEGKFTSETIDPVDTWTELIGDRGLLVSSVDEYHSRGTRDSISFWISDGCSTLPRKDKVQLGQVTFPKCNGPYEELGIQNIANAAIVIYSDVGGIERCRYLQAGYEECMDQALDKALRDIFRNIREGPVETPSAIVLPALGTGFGGLPKRISYLAIRDRLFEELRQPRRTSALPDRVILQVYRGDDPEDRELTRYAIAEVFSQFHMDWLAIPHNPAGLDLSSNLLGVVLALAVVVVLLAIGIAPPRLRDTADFVRRNSILVTVGWAFAAIGAIGLVRSFSESLLDTSGPLVEVGIGALAVAASLFAYVGSKYFRKIVPE